MFLSHTKYQETQIDNGMDKRSEDTEKHLSAMDEAVKFEKDLKEIEKGLQENVSPLQNKA